MAPRPAAELIMEMDSNMMEDDDKRTKQIINKSNSGDDKMLAGNRNQNRNQNQQQQQQQQQQQRKEEEDSSLSSMASTSIATPKDLSLSNNSSQHSCSSSSSALLLLKNSSNSSLMSSSSRIRQLKIQRQLQLSRMKGLLEMNRKATADDKSFLISHFEVSEEMNNLKKAVSLLEECHTRNQRLIQRNKNLETALIETRQKRKMTDKKYRAAIRRIKQLEEEANSNNIINKSILLPNQEEEEEQQQQQQILSSSQQQQQQEDEQKLKASKTQRQQQDGASSVSSHTSQLSENTIEEIKSILKSEKHKKQFDYFVKLSQQMQQQQQQESSPSSNTKESSNNNDDEAILHLSMELKTSQNSIKKLQNENIHLRQQIIEQQQQQQQQQRKKQQHHREQEQKSEVVLQHNSITTSSATKGIAVQQSQQPTQEESTQHTSSSNESTQASTEQENSSSSQDLEYYKQLSLSLAKKLEDTKLRLTTELEGKTKNGMTIQRDEVVEDAISNYFHKIYNPRPSAKTRKNDDRKTNDEGVLISDDGNNSEGDEDKTLLALSLVAEAKNRRKSMMPLTTTKKFPRSSFATIGRSFSMSRITLEPDDLDGNATHTSRISSSTSIKSRRSSTNSFVGGSSSNDHVDPDDTYFDANKSIANLLYNNDNNDIEISASSPGFVQDSATKRRPSFWGSLF